MIIHKILNNNVVITLDDDKREQIVMGKGIAFKKRIGDWVPDESIDQVFYLANQETSLKFQELLGNIPLEMMKLSDDIIVYAKSTLKKSLNDTIYISLTDHLYTALERKKQGIAIKNLLLWDIKRFFPEEYEVGVNALKMVQKRVGMELSTDEAGFIALHLVNAEMEEEERPLKQQRVREPQHRIIYSAYLPIIHLWGFLGSVRTIQVVSYQSSSLLLLRHKFKKCLNGLFQKLFKRS